MNTNKLLQAALLAAAVIVTYISASSAQAEALADQTPNLFIHGLAFLLAFALVVAVIYVRPKRR